jgi:hypothetical protein
MTDFDRDPEALAWARAKVQAHLNRYETLLAQAKATAAKNPEHMDVVRFWFRLAGVVRRDLTVGTECVHAAFDARLPDLLARIDAAESDPT